MKRFIYILLSASLLVVAGSCEDFLDVPPQAAVDSGLLSGPDNIDGLVVSAYAMLGQDHYTVPGQLWPWGNLRAGDAYKGGDGPSDIAIYHAMEVFNTIQPDMSAYAPSVLGDINDKKWLRQYTAISRVNFALRTLNEMDPSVYPLRNQRIAEMHFLRGHYYFDLKILYKFIPWIDENALVEDILATTNRELTDLQLWDKIIEEFRLAAGGLSETQNDAGRPSKYTAEAYLAKALLYAAYEQNDENQVTSIDAAKLEEVVDLVSDVEINGSFGLEPDFANPFLYAFENGPESVWAIQRSHDDGTITGNIDFGSALNNPMSTEFGCCGFHVPSQNLANAFKTDANGLPQFDSYNQSDLNLLTETVDPRLDHTIAQPDKPWKYETSIIYTEAEWSRQPGIYGPFSSLKENESPNCECFEQIPPFMSTSKNTILIRYADVLLWKAEALIELGRHAEALPIINSIRQRAVNSTTLLRYANGDPLSDYLINEYDGSNWTQEYARQALRWERRLELALEGHRFFDLVRWGIAAESLNEYLSVEKTKREYLESAQFEAGKNEYLPIPQQQINLSNNNYIQNIGYN